MRNILSSSNQQPNTNESRSLVHLRNPLRLFIENSIPFTSQETYGEEVVEKIMSIIRPHLMKLVVPEGEYKHSTVDFNKTIESLIRKFCTKFIKLLYNNGQL